jgi:hypothetical protein
MATKTAQKWADLHKEAVANGLAKMNECRPTPMIVGTPTTPLGNEIDYDKQHWVVPGGVCGFAWVTITPGTHGFAKWAAANGYGRKHYYGGTAIHIHEHLTGLTGPLVQSMELKQAFAAGYAATLREAGITAHAGSRMD